MGTLTPFNVYVALTRPRGWDGIRSPHGFDEKLLTKHSSEFLRAEVKRLAKMNKKTKEWRKDICMHP